MSGNRDNENQPFEIDELELPPIEDDSVTAVEQAAIDAVVDDYDDGVAGEDFEDNLILVSEHDIVADLVASGEVSFLDDQTDTDTGLVVTMDDELDESEGWVDDQNDSNLDYDDVLSEDFDLSEGQLEMDDGAEGPAEENFNIDRSGWDELEDTADEEDDQETTLEVMERLGIQLSEIEDQDSVEIDEEHEVRGVLAHHYLGPVEGRALAVALEGGTPIAVGEGMFQVAADGLLHRCQAASEIEQHIGTSVFVFRGLTYIGTKSGGILVIDELGGLLGTLNGWVSLGFDDPTQYHDRISTSVEIFGLRRREMLELFVLTQKGQLLASLDLGLTWQGPLLSKKCVSMATNESTGELLLLVDDINGGHPELFITKDLETFDAVALPEALVAALRDGGPRGISLGAAGPTIAIALDALGEPVYSTLDRGGRWFLESSPSGVTAIAVDPEATGWIAVAAARASGEGSSLRVSEDGGRTWRIVIDRICTERPGQNSRRGDEVFGLTLDVSSGKELLALAENGVYHIVLPVKLDVH